MSTGEPPAPGMPGKISDFRLDSFIGRGRLADVYRAQDERLGRTVAVKILNQAAADDAAFRNRFLRETEVTGEIAHPNIIPVYEVGDMGGILYVAMLYTPGGDCGSLVGKAGPLPIDRAWSIIGPVASALDAAHAHGLLHRDVKPANVLIGPRQPQPGPDGGGHVYLADFGMGSPTMPPGANPETDPAERAPDFDYVAPEQIAGQNADGRADLYSLACTAYYLLCGTPPFGQEQGMVAMRAHLHARPPTATARRPDLPAAVDLVLATGLAKNPADRYPTCGEFAAALQSALGLGARGPADAPLLPAPGPAGPPSDIWPAYGEVGVTVAAGPGSPGPKPMQAPGPVLVGPEGPVPPAGPLGPAPLGTVPSGPVPSGPVPSGPVPSGPVPSGPVPPGPVPPDPVRPDPLRAGSGPPGAAPACLTRPGLVPPGPVPPGPVPPGPVPPGSVPPTDDSFPEQADWFREPRAPSAGGLDPTESLGSYQEPGSPDLAPDGPNRDPDARYPQATQRHGGPARQYPQRSRRAKRGVIGSAGVVVVVVVAVVAGVVLLHRSGPPKAAPGSSPKASAASSPSASSGSGGGSAQAAAVNNLLSASASARSSLAAAVAQVRKCASVPTAVSQVQSVVNQRTSEVSQASALSTGALPNGARVKSDLVAALRSSLAADSDYLTWAQQESSACKPGATTPAYNAAVGADSQASTAKQAFAGVWDPVAAIYHLPTQSANSF